MPRARHRVPHLPDLPRFQGGLVGYFSYDTVRFIEKRLAHSSPPDDLGTPDIGHWRVPRTLETWGEFKPSEHLYYFDRHTLARLLAPHGLVVTRVRFALKPGLKVCVRHAAGA